MESSNLEWKEVQELIDEMAELQHRRLLECARRIVPYLTEDDLLQPNDFPELENHPHFRYEEGILEGIRGVQIAVRALKKP